MDFEESSSSDGFVTIHLPDDLLLFLVKHYLKEQDCLSLAMSGASDTFASLYTTNRFFVLINHVLKCVLNKFLTSECRKQLAGDHPTIRSIASFLGLIFPLSTTTMVATQQIMINLVVYEMETNLHPLYL